MKNFFLGVLTAHVFWFLAYVVACIYGAVHMRRWLYSEYGRPRKGVKHEEAGRAKTQ